MKKSFFLLSTLAVLFLFSCNRPKTYRTETGLLYKIIPSSAKDSIARLGNMLKIHYIQKLKDSLIESTYDKMPIYQMVLPPNAFPYNPLEVIGYGVREGDSVVTIQRLDSMVAKKILTKIPDGYRKDDEWISTYKIIRVFRSDSAVSADREAEKQKLANKQKQLGPERIQQFLSSNNRKAAPTPFGVFVEEIQKGSGQAIDSGKYVRLNFTMSTLKGKVLDSNTDTSFHHNTPLQYTVSSGYMFPAVDEGLKQLQQGARARIYIPTMLAFGDHPQVKGLKPYEDIIFQVEVLEILDKAPPAQKAAGK